MGMRIGEVDEVMLVRREGDKLMARGGDLGWRVVWVSVMRVVRMRVLMGWEI